MDTESFTKLAQAITAIEAQEALLNLKVAIYPKLKESDQKKFLKQLNEAAFPLGKQKIIKTNELMGFLSKGI